MTLCVLSLCAQVFREILRVLSRVFALGCERESVALAFLIWDTLCAPTLDPSVTLVS